MAGHLCMSEEEIGTDGIDPGAAGVIRQPDFLLETPVLAEEQHTVFTGCARNERRIAALADMVGPCLGQDVVNRVFLSIRPGLEQAVAAARMNGAVFEAARDCAIAVSMDRFEPRRAMSLEEPGEGLQRIPLFF